MAHAFASFIREQMDVRKLRNRDVVRDSGLSRQLVSKYANDTRDRLTRLPEKETLDGFAKALHASPEFLLGKAIESLGLGYTSGDFVNSVLTATDAELLEEIGQRLQKRGEAHADRAAANKTPEAEPAYQTATQDDYDLAAADADERSGEAGEEEPPDA